jgi:hypothetical protein
METIMTKQPITLEQRIAVTVQPDINITSADLAALIEEAESGIAKAEQEATVDQTLSFNPAAARQAIADATFAGNRLRMLLAKLQTRYQQLREQEEATAWLAELDAFKPERDALAEELCGLYPDVVTKIVDLFVRINANDTALSGLLQKRPAGVMEHLLSAELHARGLDSFSNNTPSLRKAVHLIDWETGREIWPPPKPSMASAFAAMNMRGPGHRFTADWAKDNERRAAAQQAERQRMADFYRRLDQEQDERENAEARERFVAQQERLTINRPLKP